MEKSINGIIGKNICELRKNKKLTQLEFAEALNYSDKSVSKWEAGDSLPNIETLYNIAKFFNVSLDDLVSENTNIIGANKQKLTSNKRNKFIITLLAISIVWTLATVVYVYFSTRFSLSVWRVFVWSVPVSLIIALVFNSLWGNHRFNYLIISFSIWSLLTAIFLQFSSYNLYTLFFLGIPAQIAVILWSGLSTRPKVRKNKNK